MNGTSEVRARELPVCPPAAESGHDLLYGVVKFWPRSGPWMARYPRKLLTRRASANIAEVARRPRCLKG